MAISASTVFQIQSTATAANANGCGFNPANANFIADGVIASGTGNSPTLTSATYSFVAGDVGAWIWFPAQTNVVQQGFFQIASVSSGVATLSASIGQGILVNSNGSIYNASTVAGITTTASTSSIKYGVDYSQSDSSRYTGTTLTGTTTACTDATNPFTAQMVGNIIHLLSGTGITVGWFEIVSISAGTATLDRSAGTTYSAVTYNTGGAASLGSSTTSQTDLNLFALGTSSATAGNIFFIKQGNYTTQSGATIAVISGNSAWRNRVEGYAVTRGDRPTGYPTETRPILNLGTSSMSGTQVEFLSLSAIGTNSANNFVGGTGYIFRNVKSLNQSTGTGIYDGASVGSIINCECVSYGGIGIQKNSTGLVSGCYLHDCGTYGLLVFSSNDLSIQNNIIMGCLTGALDYFSGGSYANINIVGNTLYGAENKLGIGLSFGSLSVVSNVLMNNILYGFTTAISGSATLSSNYSDYNCFSNNTTDIGSAANWQKGSNDISVNPAFTNVAQITGLTATTTAGNHLVQSGASFISAGVTPGRDYCQIKSGTGAGVAGVYGIVSVDSATQITLDRTITANATADKVWQITTGRNFLPTGLI